MSDFDKIKQYVLDEFLSGVGAEELDADYDLRASGVIDSLGLLRVVTWLEKTFDIPVADVEIAEQDFATLTSISLFVRRHTKTGSSVADAA
jgi:acyl carrier protein